MWCDVLYRIWAAFVSVEWLLWSYHNITKIENTEDNKLIKKEIMATIDLSKYGITDVKEVLYNPSYETLYEEETKSDLTGFDPMTSRSLSMSSMIPPQDVPMNTTPGNSEFSP